MALLVCDSWSLPFGFLLLSTGGTSGTSVSVIKFIIQTSRYIKGDYSSVGGRGEGSCVCL